MEISDILIPEATGRIALQFCGEKLMDIAILTELVHASIFSPPNGQDVQAPTFPISVKTSEFDHAKVDPCGCLSTPRSIL